MKRTELKRTPFKKKSRAETKARAKKKAARAKLSNSIERAMRRERGHVNRDAVILRDLGFCALCRRDCNRYQRWLDGLPARTPLMQFAGGLEDGHTRTMPFGRYLGRHKARARVLLGRLWGVVLPFGASLFEIDHIRPVAEGGNEDLSNLRTLCRRCHRIETAYLNHRLRSRPTKGIGRGF